MNVISIAIHGAAGRMGRRLVALAVADPKLQIVAALASPTSPELGKDAGVLAGLKEFLESRSPTVWGLERRRS